METHYQSFKLGSAVYVLLLANILGHLGVWVAGGGVRVQIYMVGDIFAQANGGHCWTLGGIHIEVYKLL